MFRGGMGSGQRGRPCRPTLKEREKRKGKKRIEERRKIKRKIEYKRNLKVERKDEEGRRCKRREIGIQKGQIN